MYETFFSLEIIKQIELGALYAPIFSLNDSRRGQLSKFGNAIDNFFEELLNE